MKQFPLLVKTGLLALCLGASSVQAQSLTDVVQNALIIYPSLQSAQAKTQAQRADIDRARAAHYPQLMYGTPVATTPMRRCLPPSKATRARHRCV